MMQKYISFFYLILLIPLFNFSVFAQNADFIANKTSGCSDIYLSVIFTNLSTGANSYIWNFGDGSPVSTLPNPTHSYQIPGTYDVTLIASNGTTTDTLILYNYIKYYKNPTANFTQDVTQGCDPLTVNFTNLSTVGDTTFFSIEWTFGDALSDTVYSPTHTYTNPGAYPVTLIVTDYHNCQSSKTPTYKINVSENLINASFTIDKPVGCFIPHTINITNNTTDTTLTYNWYFGDSTFSNLYSPVPHAYNEFGNYPISLVVNGTSGCSDSVSQVLSINPFSTDFKIDTTGGCNPFTAQFTNLSSAGSTFWKWDFGDLGTSTVQNPSHLFDTTGTYTVTLISGNANCSDTITKNINIIVYPKPTINFIAQDSTACYIPFNANFSTTGDSVQSWAWTFTGGVPSSSTESMPVITYNDSLDYSVSLTVVDSNNCSSSLTKTDYIKINLPIAHYGFFTKQGCIPLPVNFIDSSTSVEDISHWYWDFGDGTPITDEQNPLHYFADTGVFSIKLIIENTKGCRDTVFLKDTVLVGDTVNINFFPDTSSGCYKLIVPFTNLSDSVGDEWFWDFGDNGTSIEQNPTHTYADTGYFDVCLTVGFHGCYDTYCKDSVALVFPPISRFAPTITVACDTPITVKFTDMSVLADYWEWDFDTLAPAFIGQTPPDVTYNKQGFYNVWLKVKNFTYGCTDSSMQTISISDIHVAFDTDTTKGCMPFTCNFTDNSETNTSIIHRYWSYGDASIFDTTISTATHTYLNNGFYNVNLTVLDQLGCFESLFIDSLIEVKNLPSPGFIANKTNGCKPLTVIFNDTTNNPAPITDWLWTFGDDSVSTDANATHTYTQRGIYDVGLTVTDQNNCVGYDTIVKYITATFPEPNFSLSSTVVCNNQSVTFTNNSSPTPNVVNDTLMYEWDFGDNSAISTLEDPSHTYTTDSDTAISFNITLRVTDRNGCIDSISKSVTISEIKANFYASETIASCPTFNVTFTDSSSTNYGTLTKWLWDFGNNAPLTDTVKKPKNSYTESGIFDVQLIVSNNYGCKDTLKIDSLIKVQGPTGTLWYDVDTSKCTPVFTFHVISDKAVRYLWDFDDGLPFNENFVDSIEYIYFNVGTFEPFVTFYDINECSGSAELDSPIIVDFPFVPTSFLSDSATCTSATGSATVIANGTKPPYTYLWNNNDTLSTTDNLVFGDYIVTVTDSIGCVGGGIVNVPQKVNNYQNIFSILINETCTGANGKATSSPSLGTPPYSYLWYNNSTTDSLTNLAKGTYYLTITDALGCLKIDSAIIERDFKGYLSNISKKDIVCVNKSGTVSVNPDGTPPFIYSWNTGNYSSSIINLDTGKYSVTIIDALGCIINDFANVEMLLNTTIDASFVSDTNNVLAVLPITFTSTSVDTIPISTYNWYIDDKKFSDTLGIRTYRFEEAGIYSVMLKIIDDYGCIDSFTTTITIKDGLEVPNVFSPNGDGENDVFYIQHSGIESFKIDIFNRWGVLLFSETAPKIYWTGRTTAGVEVPDGVYYYILEATTVLGEIFKLTGNIQLFR